MRSPYDFLLSLVFITIFSVLDDQRSYFSNYGACVDVHAPGENIISACAKDTAFGCTSTSEYASMTGTSMATPHVAGITALYFAQTGATRVSGATLQSVFSCQSSTGFLGGIGDNNANNGHITQGGNNNGPTTPNKLALTPGTTMHSLQCSNNPNENPAHCPASGTGNGRCGDYQNTAVCRWDGGDCCRSTCEGTPCNHFVCKDSTAS